MAAPVLFVVDPMAPVEFAVLLRAPGPNVPVPDFGDFDPQHEGEGELLPVVTLQALDREREGPPLLRKEGQAELGWNRWESRSTRKSVQSSRAMYWKAQRPSIGTYFRAT